MIKIKFSNCNSKQSPHYIKILSISITYNQTTEELIKLDRERERGKNLPLQTMVAIWTQFTLLLSSWWKYLHEIKTIERLVRDSGNDRIYVNHRV